MAFPVVDATATGDSGTSNVSDHPISLPTGSGGLLVVIFGSDSNSDATTSSTGWTRQGIASNGTNLSGTIFTSTTGGPLTVQTAVAEQSSHVSARVSGAGAVSVISANGSNVSAPDPAALTPGGGAQDYLWLLGLAVDANPTGNNTVTAPSGFGTPIVQQPSSTSGVLAALTTRNLNASSLDPGTFTLGTLEQWVCWTIAIAPASSGGGGGGGGGGGFSTPGQAHNIGRGDGKNHFNLGKGLVSGHIDITENALESGHVDPSHYYLTPDRREVVMAVDLDGGTTSANTAYPRMEYRELQPGGSGNSDTPKAEWSGASGDHYLDVWFRVGGGSPATASIPPNKPEVVVGQIHGGSDDTAKIKWVGSGTSGRLVATYGDNDYATIASGLTLGEKYHYKLRALNGDILFYLDDMATPKVRISDASLVEPATQYFKFGCYAQTNDERDAVGDGPMVVHILADPQPVCWHTGYPPPSAPAGPPVVSAGADASTPVGSVFTRTAAETSSTAITSRSWTIVSGPVGAGSVLSTDRAVSWTPVTAGTYVLRYLASNASGTSTPDDVTVTVTNTGGGDPGTGAPLYPTQFPDQVAYPTFGVGSTTVPVANTSELTSKLAAAVPGHRLVLANTTFSGDFTMSGKLATQSNGITIDALSGATFAAGSSLVVKDCEHVTLANLRFPFDSPGDTLQFRGRSRFCRVRDTLIGPSSHTASAEVGNYLFIGDDCEHIQVDYCSFINKGTGGNAVRAYGNFDKVDAGNGADAGVRHVRIAHNLFKAIKPEVSNDKEPTRLGVSTMSRTDTNSVVERNVYIDCASEPEVLSIKFGKVRATGNVFLNCAGGPVIRHGRGSILSDNYVLDLVGTTASAGLKSGGARFYDTDHEVDHNYFYGLLGTGFQASLLLDTGDAEGSSTALSNHWRVERAKVRRNVIINCATPIQIGDNYSSAPRDCEISDNITAGITGAFTKPIHQLIAPVNLTQRGNLDFASASAGGFVADSNGIHRRTGYGPRLTYLLEAHVGAGGTKVDGDGTGFTIGTSGGGTDPGGGTPTADLYVATTGNDSNSGTSPTAPKRTIASALAAAADGQVIQVASGTYSGNVVSSKGGSAAGGYITIRSEVKHGAVISGNDAGEEAAVVLNHQYLRIQDMTITGTNSSGLRIGVLVKASNVQIVGNKIHNVCRFLTGGTGFQGGGGIDFAIANCSNILIDGNVIFDIGAPGSDEQLVHGMYLSSHVTNGRAVNNLIYNVEDFGFHPYDESEASGWQIINNTVVNTGRGILQAPNGTTRNNIVYNTTGARYDIRGSGNVVSNNIGGGTGTGSVSGVTNTDPRLVNPVTNGSGDFRLRSDSPALNAGTTNGAPTNDIVGTTRPQGTGVDIGCYETLVAGAPTKPVVGAGGDATAIIGQPFSRVATETGTGITARAWTIVSAPASGGSPGTVLSTSETLSWVPTVPGPYTLRYSATNAAGTGEDDVTVTVGTGGTCGGPVTSPAFVAVAGDSGASTAVDVPAPAGVGPGYAQIAVILSAGPDEISQVPAGWQLWDTGVVTSPAGDRGGPSNAYLYVNTTGAAGPATWQKSTTRFWHAVRAAWKDQTALGQHAGIAETTGATTHTTPAVAPSRPNSRVIGVVCTDLLNASAGPFTPPAGWTPRYDQTQVSSTEQLSIAIADVAAGPVDTSGTFTGAAADEAAVFALVLEGPIADQVIATPGIPPSTTFGEQSFSALGPPLQFETPGVPSRLTFGRHSFNKGPGAHTFFTKGIPPS